MSTSIKVDQVSMMFNMSSEKVDNIKEYFIRVLKHKIAVEPFWALQDVSFELKRGDSLGVIGLNGSGKSTLLKCMNRILTADSGHCRIDGGDLLTLSHREIAKRVAFVAQHVPDTQMTVPDMVMLGRRPYMTWGVTEHDHHVVHEAMRYLNLEDMRGRFLNRLSGGERQRISIARAFLKDAPIILLDEATASLDVENETAIQEALSRLIKNKTVLIIAHRMRTVAGADKVVVLKDGIVAEQGRPDELYARNGLYAHMVDLQSASQNWTI